MSVRVAIAGANGQLGSELVRAFSLAGREIHALARPTWDIERSADRERLVALHPDVVINAAAWTDVDGCAHDPARAMRVNGDAAGALAAAAARVNAFFVQISTNEVFDGRLERPYGEQDEPNPINSYGASKLAAERLVASVTSRYLIVRTAWIYGGQRSFPVKIRAAAEAAIASGRRLRVVGDELGNPTPAALLADAIAQLSLGTSANDVRIVHIAGEPPTSRLAWARHVLQGSPVEVEAVLLRDYQRESVTPKTAVLDMRRARELGVPSILWRRWPG